MWTSCVSIGSGREDEPSGSGFLIEDNTLSDLLILNYNQETELYADFNHLIVTTAHIVDRITQNNPDEYMLNGNSIKCIKISSPGMISIPVFSAKIIHLDKECNLALLTLVFEHSEDVSNALYQLVGFRGLHFNPTEPKHLDKVYSIGCPKPTELSITNGIITDTNRKIYSKGLYQTDATINDSFSGGPLINNLGFVVGVATNKIPKNMLCENYIWSFVWV